jgi:putative ABC transport system permease protein
MTGLALRSLRHRLTASVATFAAVLLGAVVMGSFAPLVQLALGSGVSSDDRSTLLTMGAVVGGWGVIIVLFSVASTVGITVGQREVEIGLLRTIGAVPRQVRRLVRAETVAVTLVAAVLGAWVANLTSRLLFLALQHAGTVSDQVSYSECWPALGVTVLVLVAASLAAASIAGRRATRGPASVVPSEGRPGTARVRRWRIVVAVLLLGHAATMGVLTVVDSANSSDPYDAMSTAGSLGLVVAVAQALLAPVLLAWGSRLLRPVLAGPAGHLAAYNTSRRSHLLAGVLAPVIILTAAAVSILMLVGIDHRTMPHGEGKDDATINLLNNVVTGMICAFAAIMVVNAFAAVVSHRRAELRRLSLLGATRRQVEGSVVAEAAVVAAVGVVLGLVASLATIVPFGLARHEGVVPDGQLWLPPLLAAAVAVLTLASARGAVHHIAGRALEAGR